MAVLIGWLLQTLGLNRQITHGLQISDLIWYVALALAGSLWFRLGWSEARTQKIRTRINASSWAVTVAAYMFALVEVMYSLFLSGAAAFAKFQTIFSSSGDPITTWIGAAGWLFVLFLAEYLAIFLLVGVPGCVLCVISVLACHFLHRTPAPAR